MGDLTRADLRLEIDKNIGSPLDNLIGAPLTALQDRLNRAIRQAEIRIARGRSLLELNRSDSVTVTVSGTPSSDAKFTALPNLWKDIFSIRWQDGSDGRAHKMTYVTQRQWDQLLGLPEETSTGVPRFYTVWKDSTGTWQLEWSPVPSQTSTIVRRFSVWPTEMVADVTKSDFEFMDDLIIAWATEWLFQSAGEIEDSKRWRDTRLEMLSQVIIEDAERPDVSIMNLGASDLLTRGNTVNPWQDPFVQG